MIVTKVDAPRTPPTMMQVISRLRETLTHLVNLIELGLGLFWLLEALHQAEGKILPLALAGRLGPAVHVIKLMSRSWKTVSTGRSGRTQTGGARTLTLHPSPKVCCGTTSV